MGRGTSKGAGTIFLRISDGKIVETVTPDHPNAVERINKNGKKVYERLDDFVEGVVTSMHERTSEFNGEEIKELCVRVQGDGETYQLALNEGSRYWSAFAMRLPNIDLTKPVKFSPYSFKDKTDGHFVIGMNIFQGSTKVEPRFTKENPGKMPQGKEVMFQGKPKWDFFERDQFLNTVIKHFADKMRAENEALYGESGAEVEHVTNDAPPVYQKPQNTPPVYHQPQNTVPPSMRQPLPHNPAAGAVHQGITVKPQQPDTVPDGPGDRLPF